VRYLRERIFGLHVRPSAAAEGFLSASVVFIHLWPYARARAHPGRYDRGRMHEAVNGKGYLTTMQTRNRPIACLLVGLAAFAWMQVGLPDDMVLGCAILAAAIGCPIAALCFQVRQKDKRLAGWVYGIAVALILGLVLNVVLPLL